MEAALSIRGSAARVAVLFENRKASVRKGTIVTRSKGIKGTCTGFKRRSPMPWGSAATKLGRFPYPNNAALDW